MSLAAKLSQTVEAPKDAKVSDVVTMRLSEPDAFKVEPPTSRRKAVRFEQAAYVNLGSGGVRIYGLGVNPSLLNEYEDVEITIRGIRK